MTITHLRHRRSPGLIGPTLALALAPSLSLAAGEAWPVPEWSVSTPAEQGLDPAPLVELIQLIEKGERFPELHSLLVVRNGRLVVEEYFGRFDRNTEHTLQSVSKSFSSAAVGVAIEKGVIRDVNDAFARTLGYAVEERAAVGE